MPCCIQAGGNGGAIETVVPAALTRLFQHPKLDWNLFSQKEQKLSDREVSTKVNAQCSLHNLMDSLPQSGQSSAEGCKIPATVAAGMCRM